MTDDPSLAPQPISQCRAVDMAAGGTARRKVLVVGALGMVGRAAMERFAGRADL